MEITNNRDIIDSREVIERIEELIDHRNDFQTENELREYPGFEGVDPAATDEQSRLWEEWDESDDGRELHILEEFQDEAEGYCPDWRYGEALVRESYFETYARELAEECDMIQKDAKWPYTCIDWKKAADDLKMDYSTAEFDGVTYLFR